VSPVEVVIAGLAYAPCRFLPFAIKPFSDILLVYSSPAAEGLRANLGHGTHCCCLRGLAATIYRIGIDAKASAVI
jgi:hypothetical protein